MAPTCSNCELLTRELSNARVKAEQAFAELRRQTDKELAAMHAKMTARGSSTVTENKALIEEISRLQDALNQKTAEVTRWRQELQIEDEQPSQLVIKLNEQLVAREHANAELVQRVMELEHRQNHENRKLSDTNKALLGELEERDALISELKAQVKQLSKEIANGLTVDPTHITDLQNRVSNLIAENTRLVTDLHDKARDLQYAQSRNAKLEEHVQHTENKLGGANQRNSEVDHDKAKVDLAYRKKLGELEASLRRSQIQSARLQQEVQQLNDNLDVVCSESERRCAAREAEAAHLKQQLEEERRHAITLSERSRADRNFYERILRERPTSAATWTDDASPHSADELRKSIRSRMFDSPTH